MVSKYLDWQAFLIWDISGWWDISVINQSYVSSGQKSHSSRCLSMGYLIGIKKSLTVLIPPVSAEWEVESLKTSHILDAWAHD